MAQYPIYNPQYGIYNPNNFSKQTSGGDALTVDTGKLYFLQFPNAQTTQTEFLHSIGVASDATFNGPVTFNETVTYEQDIEYKQNVMVDGDATIIGNFLGETGTFQDVLTCQQGIDISVAPYGITFPDNTTQTTAFIEANYAQLNTDNIFLAPYKNVFQGNNSTNAANAPLQISNVTNSDNVSLYIDPSPSIDLTLYSAQSNGGLTVRNPTASFTLNPVTISPGIVGARSLNPIDMNGYDLLGLTNVYADGNGITFIDSANAPMLQLTNGGHTSYENLNMNYNDISNVDNVSFASSGSGSTASFQNNVNQNGGTYFVLNTNQGYSIAINGVERTRYNGTNIQFFNPVLLPTDSTAITQTYPNNTTAIATCQYVTTAINNIAPQDLSNYAQLNTGTVQTFTGPIQFQSNVKYNGNIIATINQLPQYTQSYLYPYVNSTINPSYGSINLSAGSPYQETQQLTLSSSAQASFLSNPVLINFGSIGGLPNMTPILALQFNDPNSTTFSNPIKPWANYPPPNAYYWVLVQTGSLTQSWPVSFFQDVSYSYVVFYSYYNMGANSQGYYDFSTLGLIPP